MPSSLEERFWSKVDKSPGYGPNGDCWIWTACVHKKKRYGRFQLSRNKCVEAHRISWILTNGNTKLHVLHKCDNPPCVNPDHLFIGTQSDNMKDMRNKGRGSKLYGEKIGNSKLTEVDVLNILKTHRNGNFTQKDLAEIYDVCRDTISSIVNKHIWRHISDEI